MTKAVRPEKAIAGSGYIISFFADIEVLVQNAANYINNITKMKLKYGKIGAKTEFDPSDQSILNIIDNMKSSVFKTYIKFMALKNKVKEFQSFDTEEKPKKKDEKGTLTIETMYKKIRDEIMPNITDVEEYALRLNTLFVEALDILTTAQGIYSDAAGAYTEGYNE